MILELHTGRLRWVLALVILADALATIWGQPSDYWSDPRLANEANPAFLWALQAGFLVFLLVVVFYIFLVLKLASIVPKKLRHLLLFSFLFGHFFGLMTWVYFSTENMAVPIAIGIAISALIVGTGNFKDPPNAQRV